MRLIPDKNTVLRRRLGLGCAGFLLLLLALVAVALIRTGPSPACLFPTQESAGLGDSIRTLETQGRRRCYLLYVPSQLDPSKSAPLVISLPGVGLKPQGLAEMTGWNAIAEREGLVVAYPQGTGIPLRWNSAAAHGDETADDVQFIVDLVAEIAESLPVDPQRVYINGLSNGGGMAFRLVCERPDLFAALGGVAGFYAPPPGGCMPGQPVPVIAFHGTADPLVLYQGGQIPTSFLTSLFGFSPARPELVYPGVEAWADAWAARNGCQTAPDRKRLTDEVEVTSYKSCSKNAAVVLYTIEGGGHAWPSQSRTGFSLTTKDIDATETIWAFFDSYPSGGETAAR